MSGYVRPIIYSLEQIEKDLRPAFEAWDKQSEEEKKKNPRWWSKHIEVNWDAEPFKGQKDSRFYNITTTFAGKRGRPQIKFHGETNGNSIVPVLEKDFQEMKKKNPNSKITEKREPQMPADLQIRKWNAKVDVDEKNKSEYKKTPDGKPILPDDKTKSKLFDVMDLYYKALNGEIKYQKSIRRIVNDETKDGAPAGFIHNDNTNIITPIKTEVKKGKNKGNPRLNPYFQMKVAFDKDKDPEKGTQFLDKRNSFKKDGKQDFHPATLEDGSRINNENIHKWIQFGCIMDGVVAVDSICLSSMGISCMAKIRIVISQPPERVKLSAADIYEGDSDTEAADDEGKPESKPAGDDKKGDSIYQETMNLMGKKN